MKITSDNLYTCANFMQFIPFIYRQRVREDNTVEQRFCSSIGSVAPVQNRMFKNKAFYIGEMTEKRIIFLLQVYKCIQIHPKLLYRQMNIRHHYLHTYMLYTYIMTVKFDFFPIFVLNMKKYLYKKEIKHFSFLFS